MTGDNPSFANRFSEIIDGALVWFRRPEFDVPVNPILTSFRGFLRGRGGEDFYQECLSLSGALDKAEDFTAEQIAHAWRVHEKLAALRKDTRS